ncbi:hypothetical protein ACFYXF_39010 [Streptomyces sp. NPDC002680]|uniref:hypothetical protein n=1 Tax=Streptomyces sp. NPDC002680 TaxID=3364659 RepID=UPI0036B9785F
MSGRPRTYTFAAADVLPGTRQAYGREGGPTGPGTVRPCLGALMDRDRIVTDKGAAPP